MPGSRTLFCVLMAAWIAACPIAAHAGVSSNAFLVRVWGVDEGLPVPSVTDITQTPDGYLWLGTLLGGLVRFDGSRFVGFHSGNTPTLRSMGVRRVDLDYAGTLWACFHDGSIATWQEDGFRLVCTRSDRIDRMLWSGPGRTIFVCADGRLLVGEEKSPQNWAWEFVTLPECISMWNRCADTEGRVWYQDRNYELRSWHRGVTTLHTATNTPGLGKDRCYAVVSDKEGRIWVGTGRYLLVSTNGGFLNATPTNAEPILSVKRIIPVGRAGLWVEANGRMRRCRNGAWEAESVGWQRSMSGVTTLRFVRPGSRGGFWAGYADYGLFGVEEDGTFHQLKASDGLPSNTLRMAFEDREGNIWTGYERGNLVQIRRRMVRSFGQAEGLNDSLLTTVTEDRDRNIWVGTASGIISRMSPDGYCENLTIPSQTRSHNSTVVVDHSGRLWIGTQGNGLFTYADGTFQQAVPRETLNGDVRLMLPTSDGRLWLGTLTNVFTLTGTNLVSAFSARNSGDYPSAMAELPDGSVCVGMFGGEMLRFYSNRVERVSTGFYGIGRLWSMCVAADGSLWIGTLTGGLIRFKDGRFYQFNKADGLPSDTVFQVLTDERQDVWMLTSAGLVRVAESALTRKQTGDRDLIPHSVYGRPEGFLTIGSSIETQPNGWRAANGTLWFAMANGATAVYPDRVRLNIVPPTVAIEEIAVEGQRLWPLTPGRILASRPILAPQAAAVTPEVSLPAGAREVTFRFAGLSLSSPERVRFQHRLEGVDDRWLDGGSERFVTYRYLQPGPYRFRVRAANSDGVWNEEGAAMDFRITPYIWQTGWFRYGLVLLAGLGLAVGVRRATRRRLARRLEHLERQRQLERERTRIAQDLHDDLGAGLTEIGLLGSLAQRSSQPPERVHEHLQRITEKAREMVTSLDEIVWSVNPRQDELQAVSRYFSEYAQQFLSLSPVRCRLEVDETWPGVRLGSEWRQNLLLAFKEALTNVVRHSRATEVQIRLGTAEGQLRITVSDNGQGARGENGAGADGLENMRQRLARMNGQCRITSSDAGTVVEFTLPLPPASGDAEPALAKIPPLT